MGRRLRVGLPAGAVCLAALFVLPSCEQAPQPQAQAVQLVLFEPCDVQLGCRAINEALTVTLIFASDMRALQPFPVKLLIDTGDQIESVSVAFEMQGMDMGWNRYSFSDDSAGVWNATVNLPICGAGRTDWTAKFDLLTAGRHYQVQVPFVLDK